MLKGRVGTSSTVEHPQRFSQAMSRYMAIDGIWRGSKTSHATSREQGAAVQRLSEREKDRQRMIYCLLNI